jgi:hypothetical protein
MIRRHEVLRCDVQGCLAYFVGPPLTFHGSIAQSEELWRLAAAEGWSREDSGAEIRHYCPGHGRPRDRTESGPNEPAEGSTPMAGVL